MNVVETLKLIGRPIAYYPKLANPLGGVNPAVLFSQLFYWQDKTSSDLGVYKTRDEIEDETGLSHNEQRTAIKKLQERGVLIVTEKRLEHKTFYKIDNEKVNQILSDFANSINKSSRQLNSSHPELYNVDVEMTTKSSSLDQENTTEITTEITTENNNKKTNKKNSFDPISVKPKNVSREIWVSWIEYKNAKKQKLLPKSWIAQSKMLESQPDAEAVINQSIMNGWAGLFPCKSSTTFNKTTMTTSNFKNLDYGETTVPTWFNEVSE